MFGSTTCFSKTTCYRLDRFQGFGFGVTFDLVGIVYGDDSPFVEGDSDFVDDVGVEKV